MILFSSSEKIVKLLKSSNGYISGEFIAQKLDISRAAVWKQICKLRKNGFCIEAQPKSGYRLVTEPDRLLPEMIKKDLKTSLIGQNVIYYDEIESTNLIAKQLAADDVQEGTIVIAENQTKGRGRLQRSWLSEPYKNILMSIVFRPRISPNRIFFLTMLISLAIVKAISHVLRLEARIKWPNDIYIKNCKVGGILTEFTAEHDQVNYVVVGIGLNVNFNPLPGSEMLENATSLHIQFGKNISRIKLLNSILQEIEKGYSLLQENKFLQIRKQWNSFSLIKGKRVKIIYPDHSEEGIAESVDEDGYLILKDDNGNKKKIVCGDVSLRF